MGLGGVGECFLCSREADFGPVQAFETGKAGTGNCSILVRHLATQHRQRSNEGLHAEPKEEQHNAPPSPSPSHRYRHPTSKRRATATRSAPHIAHCPPAWSHPPTLVPTPHRSVCAPDQQTSTLSAIRHPPSEQESTPHPRHATALGPPQSRDLTPARDLIHTAGSRRLSNHSCQRIIHPILLASAW